MLKPSRLFFVGVALLIISIGTSAALGIPEPADRQNLGFSFHLYWFVAMLWVPAVALIALSVILPLWFRIIDWAEGRR
jgi:hypothetical protein